jgi:hypothetical protein
MSIRRPRQVWPCTAPFAGILFTILYCSCNYPKHATNLSEPTTALSSTTPSMKYEIIENTPAQSIVLIKEPVQNTIDSSRLSFIADSLYNNKAQNIEPPNSWYRVWFYYRRDWKGKTYYAGKFWKYDYETRGLIAEKIDISGITGNDKQDALNLAMKNVTAISSFDTLSYLNKLRKLNTAEINNLKKKQLNKDGELGTFIEKCERLRDSAGIVTDEPATYSHLYYRKFINTWGVITYPVTKNNFTYSGILLFEGTYDLFGNEVHFKSSLNR